MVEERKIIRINGDMEYDIDHEYEEGSILFIDGVYVASIKNITTNVDVVINAYGIVSVDDVKIRTSKNLIILSHSTSPMINSINVWGNVIFLESKDTFKVGYLSIGKNLIIDRNSKKLLSVNSASIDGAVYVNEVNSNEFIGKKMVRPAMEEHIKEIEKWKKFIKDNKCNKIGG